MFVTNVTIRNRLEYETEEIGMKLFQYRSAVLFTIRNHYKNRTKDLDLITNDVVYLLYQIEIKIRLIIKH